MSRTFAWLPLASALILSATVIVTTGCEVTSSDDDEGSDTSSDVALDTAMTDTATDPGTLRTEPFTETPSPTTITLSAERQSDGSDWYRAGICMVNALIPDEGITLQDSCGGSGNGLILAFVRTSRTDGIVHLATSGIFNIASSSAGDQGEGPVPGSTGWRLPVGTPSDLRMRSVVLGQTTYDAEFTVTIDSSGVVTVSDIDFTPI